MSRRGKRRRGWLDDAAEKLVEHHRSLGDGAPKWKWLWWGWRDWALCMGGPWPSIRRPVLRWWVRVGPLELRRWGP